MIQDTGSLQKQAQEFDEVSWINLTRSTIKVSWDGAMRKEQMRESFRHLEFVHSSVQLLGLDLFQE